MTLIEKMLDYFDERISNYQSRISEMNTAYMNGGVIEGLDELEIRLEELTRIREELIEAIENE